MSYNGEDMIGDSGFGTANYTKAVDDFIRSFNIIQSDVHEITVEHGFWNGIRRSPAECVALMHAELSEALEVMRAPVPNDSKESEELADCIIRIMDYAEFAGLDIATALIRKVEYNRIRPHKHGKKF